MNKSHLKYMIKRLEKSLENCTGLRSDIIEDMHRELNELKTKLKEN